MNPEQILTFISKVIETRNPQLGMMYYIGVWDGIVDVRLCKQPPLPEKVFMRARGDKMLNGFTTKEWDHLLYEVAIYFKHELEQLEQPAGKEQKCQLQK